MNKNEVNSAVYDGLSKILVPAGFKGRESDCRFIRRTSFGFQDVGVPLWDYDPTFAFSVNLALRFDAIQDEANPLYPLAPKYWADSFTILLKPAFFLGQPLKFEVQTLDEITHAMSETEDLFRQHIFPFFDSCNDLATVERLLNEDPHKTFTANRVGHAITGVIAAALCRRPDFPDIVARYRDILSGSVAPIRERFEAAVAHATANLLPN
jgi:hypothetical protein